MDTTGGGGGGGSFDYYYGSNRVQIDDKGSLVYTAFELYKPIHTHTHSLNLLYKNFSVFLCVPSCYLCASK